jgi:hypothetical protein
MHLVHSLRTLADAGFCPCLEGVWISLMQECAAYAPHLQSGSVHLPPKALSLCRG